MKFTLTNEQVFEIVYLLTNLYPEISQNNNLPGVPVQNSNLDKRFRFACARNLSNLGSIAEDLITARKSENKDFLEFESKREDIIKKYAQTDENGNLITDENQNYVFDSDEQREKGQSELDVLREQYKDALKAREKEIEIYNEILTTEVEVDIIQCKFEALPDNFPFNQLRMLIKETDDEIEAML